MKNKFQLYIIELTISIVFYNIKLKFIAVMFALGAAITIALFYLIYHITKPL